MRTLFNTLLVEPFLNALVFIYEYITFEDLGFAIIVLTIIIRFILYPLFYKSIKSQAMVQKIQPQITEIQKKYKTDKEKQAQELMRVYKENNVNPFASIGYIFAQLPILWAVYAVFLKPFNEETFISLYSFIPQPEHISSTFLQLIDLTKPNIIIVGVAVIVQYIHARLSLPRIKQQAQGQAAKMAKYMVYAGPIIALIILPNFSAAIGLYWATSSVFTIFQQIIINKQIYGTETTGKN